MTSLAVANIMHRKLRSSLSAMGVMIGIASLITMLSLSHGTLDEVAKRIEGIDADIVVLPSKSSLIFSEGAPLSDKYISKIKSIKIDGKNIVSSVYPVYLNIMPNMAGQQQRVFAIRSRDFKVFTGKRKIVFGRFFDDKFERYVNQLRKESSGNYSPDKVDRSLLDKSCLLVIDDRLARAGNYKIGSNVSFLGRKFVICGIVESGSAARVFAPLEVVRYIQNGGIEWSSMFFVKLISGVSSVEDAKKKIEKATHLQVIKLSDYNAMLFENFKPIYIYINIASALVLIVSFLFVMVTIYTIVLERRKEIGILRSMGADSVYILKQTIGEAMIISIVGTSLGIIVSYISRWLIEGYRPLLTVDIKMKWLVLAGIVAIAGALISAIYPGLRAIREDPVEVLSYE